MESARLTSPAEQPPDIENTLRPQTLADFTGQRAVCSNLKVFIDSARSRKEPLDHVLLYGPPGLGKTTLAQIVARELAVGFRATSGPMLTKAGDLAAILTNLQAGDVLFIDEIHRLNASVEETLYPALEDFQARHHHRRRPGGARHTHRPAAVHIGGGDDAAGAA